jgi:hypothetical protein
LIDASCNRVKRLHSHSCTTDGYFFFHDETNEHRVGLGTSIVRLIRARGGVESRLTLYQIC